MSDSTPSVTVRVRQDNAAIIPAWFRDKHDINPGDDVIIQPIEFEEPDDLTAEEIEELKELITKAYGNRRDVPEPE